jgi:hypothetical protein
MDSRTSAIRIKTGRSIHRRIGEEAINWSKILPTSISHLEDVESIAVAATIGELASLKKLKTRIWRSPYISTKHIEPNPKPTMQRWPLLCPQHTTINRERNRVHFQVRIIQHPGNQHTGLLTSCWNFEVHAVCYRELEEEKYFNLHYGVEKLVLPNKPSCWLSAMLVIYRGCTISVSKVCTPNYDTFRSLTPIKAPKLDTICFQFQHRFSIVTNGSWGVLWGSQWEVKHFVLEGVQLRTSLVSQVGESTRLTSRISSIFRPSPKILKPLLDDFPSTC